MLTTQLVVCSAGDRFVRLLRRDVALDGHPLPLKPAQRNWRPRLSNAGYEDSHQDNHDEQKDRPPLHARNLQRTGDDHNKILVTLAFGMNNKNRSYKDNYTLRATFV